MATTRIQEIRSVIARGKRWDLIFAIVGILCLMIGLLTVAALFIDMAVKGLPRISSEFFTNFPSRRAESAGILSAWVGSTLVMVVTAVTAVPIGVAAGVYLEEYAPRNWMTDVIEINITIAAPSSSTGCRLGLFVYQLASALRMRGGLTSRAADTRGDRRTRRGDSAIPPRCVRAPTRWRNPWQTVRYHTCPIRCPESTV